ncbi:MFS-type transporter [Trichostrongylus colubriformis]|uniref:MFS-type transporter n=1 Tax=Trichostrongylus colubriformis TaxID=6319 RepID=A0AAN8IZG9_TRICO
MSTESNVKPGSGRVAEVLPVSADKTSPPTDSGSGRDMGIGNDLQLQMERTDMEPRVYKKRWVMLAMFISLSASNGAQWIMYSVIAQIVADFYGVSFAAVDWTSMIYMATYIALFIPAAYLLDKYGLRLSLLLGATGNAVGAWIRMFSTNPDGFWITFVGQSIVGASQMFTLGIPPRLAAVWFGPNEVSTACAAGVFGNQLGIAAGFLVPPLIVRNGTQEEVSTRLTYLFLSSALLNTAIFALIVCFFSARPPTPPSLAQITAQEEKTLDSNFWRTLTKLMLSKNFILLFITYGRSFSDSFFKEL